MSVLPSHLIDLTCEYFTCKTKIPKINTFPLLDLHSSISTPSLNHRLSSLVVCVSSVIASKGGGSDCRYRSLHFVIIHCIGSPEHLQHVFCVEMKPQTIMIFGTGLLSSVVGIKALESPACVSKCWDNSKYVSSCLKANETQCFCEDTEFQSVVLQCLYSQCQTTQFGSALHHTLSVCTDYGVDTSDASPPLVRHQSIRKRGSPSIGSASGHLSASVIHSVARRSVSASAYGTTRPTHSIGHVPIHTHDLPLSSSVATTALSNSANLNESIVLALPTRVS